LKAGKRKLWIEVDPNILMNDSQVVIGGNIVPISLGFKETTATRKSRNRKRARSIMHAYAWWC